MSESGKLFFDHVETPVGRLVLVADNAGQLRMLSFHSAEDEWRREFKRWFAGATPVARRDPFGLVSKLKAYFEGDMDALESIPVSFGGTPFQNKVWNALRGISVGTTTSYGALAKKIGEPKAMRAVGLANGSNPIAIVVPCHRVIGSDGTLTGYGGGLPRKRWLLDHEARHCAKSFELEATA
jgi:methylated-DNA-[protein]-cysteine S-methyltransferase